MAFLIFFNKTLSFLCFLLLLLCFSSSVPSIYSLSTFAISETSNQTLICGLNEQSFLNCSSFPTGIQIPGANFNFSYSGIVAGDGFLCGLKTSSSSSSSILLCWRFSANGTNMPAKRIYSGPEIGELQASNSHICGLVKTNNSLQCWQWREFNNTLHQNQSFSSIAVGEDFVCGLSRFGNINCSGTTDIFKVLNNDFNNGNYTTISAGFRHACALNRTNDLHCAGNMLGVAPQDKFKLLALGENRSCGLRINDTVVCWGENNFNLPENLRESYFVSIEAKRNVFCGVLKRNLSLICWGNEIFDSNLMVFEEVMPGPCRNVCPCGILGGVGKFCSQGDICEQCINYTINPPPVTPPCLPPPPQLPPPRSSGSSGWSTKMIAYLVVGCVGSSALLLVIAFFLFKYCKCRGCRVHDSGRLDAPLEEGTQQPHQQHQQQPPQTEQGPQVVLEKRLSELASMGNAGHLEDFSLQVLHEATSNFSEEYRIGTGSFGSVYRGILEDGREVAIKRAESSSACSYAVGTRRQEDKDSAFINELESLSRLHHKNLVRLLGFCEESNERVLVYEYVGNGTLYDHLHKLDISPLMTWAARIKVALDAARGIEYLHEYAVPPIIHRDIKSSNILLDSSWTAKVSDFGLSLMGPEDEDSHLSMLAAGTVGYMDPEYYRLQQLTTKSDVYSFGVVLLELLSGFKAIHKNENGVPRNVVDFVVPYIIQDEIHRVLDKRAPPPTPFEIEAVAYVGYLAADCVTLEGRDRPSMTDIVNSLERALAACLVHPTSLSRSTTGSST